MLQDDNIPVNILEGNLSFESDLLGKRTLKQVNGNYELIAGNIRYKLDVSRIRLINIQRITDQDTQEKFIQFHTSKGKANISLQVMADEMYTIHSNNEAIRKGQDYDSNLPLYTENLFLGLTKDILVFELQKN